VSNEIRTIEHDGQTYIVSSVDLSTADTIIHARRLISCKYDKKTLNVTSATTTRKTVRIVNPEAKPKAVKFTKTVALKLMGRLSSTVVPSVSLKTVHNGAELRDGLAGALGKADAYTSRLVAKALGGRDAFELRCHAVALDLGIDFESASVEDRATIESLAKEEKS
jgi:hypothetical protein